MASRHAEEGKFGARTGMVANDVELGGGDEVTRGLHPEGGAAPVGVEANAWWPAAEQHNKPAMGKSASPQLVSGKLAGSHSIPQPLSQSLAPVVASQLKSVDDAGFNWSPVTSSPLVLVEEVWAPQRTFPSAPLPPPPTYLEPYTTFVSAMPVAALGQSLIDALEAEQERGGLEYELFYELGKIVLVADHGSTRALLRLYAPADGHTVVELQRRSGSGMQLTELYRRIIERLPGAASESSSVRVAGATSRPIALAPGAVFGVEAVMGLMSMLQSRFVDVQLEALRAFVSALCDNSETMAVSDAINLAHALLPLCAQKGEVGQASVLLLTTLVARGLLKEDEQLEASARAEVARVAAVETQHRHHNQLEDCFELLHDRGKQRDAQALQPSSADSAV